MRFSLGIIFSCWSALEASLVEKDGKHGLAYLRDAKGVREPDPASLVSPGSKTSCFD